MKTLFEKLQGIVKENPVAYHEETIVRLQLARNRFDPNGLLDGPIGKRDLLQKLIDGHPELVHGGSAHPAERPVHTHRPAQMNDDGKPAARPRGRAKADMDSVDLAGKPEDAAEDAVDTSMETVESAETNALQPATSPQSSRPSCVLDVEEVE
jgi:hypothetical protein